MKVLLWMAYFWTLYMIFNSNDEGESYESWKQIIK